MLSLWGGSYVDNMGFLLFYFLDHELYGENTREQFDWGTLIIHWHSWWDSIRRKDVLQDGAEKNLAPW